jgi:hypothetical protein
MEINLAFSKLFEKRFRQYFSNTKRISRAAWHNYKKKYDIHCEEIDRENYESLLLNPFGSHYLIPKTFITEVVSLNYVPPLEELPEINIDPLVEMLKEKHKKIKEFNAKVPTYTNQDRNWDKYLNQIGALLFRTRKSFYIRDIPYFEQNRLTINEYDCVIVPDPFNSYNDELFIKFENAVNFIENGLPESNFELVKFKPNYQTMPEYQPW